jgi:hypothetical protein
VLSAKSELAVVEDDVKTTKKLLLCMARHYESQSKMLHAENFNRRAREMIIASKHRDAQD